MAEFKQKLGVAYKRGLSGGQMKKMALTYKQRLQDDGIEILEDPFEHGSHKGTGEKKCSRNVPSSANIVDGVFQCRHLH